MKRFRLRIRVLAVLAAAIGSAGLWGCGSPGNCDTFVEDYCARFSECEPGIYAFLSGGDAATCRARFLPACTQSITIDGAKLSSDAAGQCGKSIRSASCDDLLSGHLPDICTPPGTRADGASCSDSLQCASTRCTGSATTCGSCVPRLKVGEPCESTDQCQYGLYCKNPGAGTGACTAFAQLGQACDATSTCLPTLFCNTGGQPSGSCAARRAAGEDCSRNTDCDGQKSLTCDPTSKKCVPYTVNYVAVGGTCSNTLAMASYNICSKDAHCVTTTGTGGGPTSTCAAAMGAGQPCNSLDIECAAGLTCTNKVCQVRATPMSCQ